MGLRGLRARYAQLSDQAEGWRKVALNLGFTAVVLCAAILFVELLVILNIGESSRAMVYILAVLIISCVTPDYLYGLIAAAAASIACDYFVTEPRMVFSFTRGSPITLLVMFGAALLTSALTEQIKAQARVARDRGRRWQLISEINEKLLSARGADAIISLANENMDAHLAPRPIVFYRSDPERAEGDENHMPGAAAADAVNAPNAVDGQSAAALDGPTAAANYANGSATDAPNGQSGAACDQLAVPKGRALGRVFLTEAERRRVHRIFQRGKAENYNFAQDKPNDVFYFPMMSNNNVLGVIGVDCTERPLSQSDLAYLSILTGQLSLAIELQNLSDAQSRILFDAEKEKMRSTLLRSVSHDLRTPLTSIIGAAGAILEQEGMELSVRERLLRDIIENAQWLVRMVENILTITKISEESMAIQKTPEAAEEVVAQAVTIARRRFPDNLIHARVPEELLIVPMDATLISQVLINLLENAAKNSPERGMILVDLRKQAPYARFEISDEGGGIPDELEGRLFESYLPGGEPFVNTERGAGLGLSICQTIVRAHGGQIEGHNRDEGGAKFVVLLPLGGD
jgi:two-component system sensor histidine kinase KdpD